MNKLISILVATVFVAAGSTAFAQDKLPPTPKTSEVVNAEPAAGAEATVEAPKAKAKAKKTKHKKSKAAAETK